MRTTDDGIPFMSPEIVLLFKAEHAGAKDVADLENCLPLLTADERAWVVDGLGRVHPGHAWIARVAT